MKIFALLLAVVIAGLAFADNSRDDLRSFVNNDIAVGGVGSIWGGSRAELYNTGPWMNSPGTGVGGADESILQSWGTTYGYGCQLMHDNFIADDFEVPAGEVWEITGMVWGAYQTGSGLTPTINAIFLAGYDDNPTTGTMVFGSYTVNVFSDAEWSNIYRVNESGSGINTDRPIMAITAEFATPWTVTEGVYWVGAQFDGTGSSGPWAPPVVIWDTPETGNGLQSTDGGIIWEPVDNGGFAQGFLMIVEGNQAGALEQSTWGSIKSVF